MLLASAMKLSVGLCVLLLPSIGNANSQPTADAFPHALVRIIGVLLVMTVVKVVVKKLQGRS